MIVMTVVVRTIPWCVCVGALVEGRAACASKKRAVSVRSRVLGSLYGGDFFSFQRSVLCVCASNN